MNETLEKIMREVKNTELTQSDLNRTNNGQTMSRIEPTKHINNDHDEINASDTENQENRLQDNPFRPSETNELSTPIQPVSNQSLDLDDTVIINENSAAEDYHATNITSRGDDLYANSNTKESQQFDAHVRLTTDANPIYPNPWTHVRHEKSAHNVHSNIQARIQD